MGSQWRMTLRSPMRCTRPLGTTIAASSVFVITPEMSCPHAVPTAKVNSRKDDTKQRVNHTMRFSTCTSLRGICMCYQEGVYGHYFANLCLFGNIALLGKMTNGKIIANFPKWSKNSNLPHC